MRLPDVVARLGAVQLGHEQGELRQIGHSLEPVMQSAPKPLQGLAT